MKRNRFPRVGSAWLWLVWIALAALCATPRWATAADPPPKSKVNLPPKGKQPAMDKDAAAKKVPSPPASRPSEVANPLAASIPSSEIDALLEKELARAGVELSPVIKDQDFLRRAYLDLTGKPPSPDKLDLFLEDSDPAKRSKMIDSLLGTDDYTHHWARYWRDVFGYHAVDKRTLFIARIFEDWLADQLKKNAHWDKIATQMITATGDVEQNGAAFLIAAQFDMENTPVNLAGETARVFMGIQIGCAQCHDHPYDQWKREQFHEMAAFFARTRVRREFGERPTLVVFSAEAGRGGRMRKAGPGGSLEYFMPDKDDPEKKVLMQPKFLLGQKIKANPSDQDRRTALAGFITDKSDYWFARAYVNRIWGELMGEGFYEPVDDLGPGREPRFPMVINRLASAWRASDYNVKWLFRLIMNTDAYQREIRPRDPAAQKTPFAAVCPTRLSADQIFDSLVNALGIDEAALTGGRADNPQARRFAAAAGMRGMFNREFGIDPSTPAEDVQGTISQALFFMNSPVLARQMSTQGDTLLGRFLEVYNDDEEVIRLLYKRVLARAPSDNEIKTCHGYIRELGNRREAFEDLLWGLVNSTEFITKR